MSTEKLFTIYGLEVYPYEKAVSGLKEAFEELPSSHPNSIKYLVAAMISCMWSERHRELFAGLKDEHREMLALEWYSMSMANDKLNREEPDVVY